MLNQVITVSDNVRNVDPDLICAEIAYLFDKHEGDGDTGTIRVVQHRRTLFAEHGACAEIQAAFIEAWRKGRVKFGPPPWPDPGPPPKRPPPEPPAVSSGLDWGPKDG